MQPAHMPTGLDDDQRLSVLGSTRNDEGPQLASFGSYVVKGGALMRMIGFSESASSLLVQSYCAPGESPYEAAARLGFKIIN